MLGPFTLATDGARTCVLRHEAVARNLLFEPATPFVATDNGTVFSVSGWDEMLPTLGASEDWPAWGWAWRIRPDTAYMHGERHLSHWRLPGFEMQRLLTAQGDTLTARYGITSTLTHETRVLWAAHVLYPTTDLSDVQLSGCDPVPGPGCDLRDLLAQLSRQGGHWRIDDVSENGLSWKFFLPATGPVTLHYADVRITVATDASWWGVFLNRGRFGEPCIGIEPTVAPTDFVHDSPVCLSPSVPHSVSWKLLLNHSLR